MSPLVWSWTCGPVTTSHRLTGTALTTARLQAVSVGPQDVDWTGDYVLRRHVDSCLSPASNHSALSAQPSPTATTHRKLGETTFSVAARRAWNWRPTELKTSTCSTDSFKRSLKSFYFSLRL